MCYSHDTSQSLIRYPNSTDEDVNVAMKEIGLVEVVNFFKILFMQNFDKIRKGAHFLKVIKIIFVQVRRIPAIINAQRIQFLCEHSDNDRGQIRIFQTKEITACVIEKEAIHVILHDVQASNAFGYGK